MCDATRRRAVRGRLAALASGLQGFCVEEGPPVAVNGLPTIRNDVEGHAWRALETPPDVLPRVREGHREESWWGTEGVSGYLRGASCQGIASVSAITGAIRLSDFMSHDKIGRLMAATNEPDPARADNGVKGARHVRHS